MGLRGLLQDDLYLYLLIWYKCTDVSEESESFHMSTLKLPSASSSETQYTCTRKHIATSHKTLTATTVRTANITEQFVVCTDNEVGLALQINALEDAKKESSKSRT
jgi:hypothetical protein